MERLKRLRDKANALPLLPGVYIMRNKEGKIIYIGKAKALKNRVVQYFRSGSSHAEKVRRMVENVEDFDYIICDSEFEALILECSLIKQHSPKYNILLKDDKGYHYIHISDEPWPRITAEKQLLSNGENIGPYNSFYTVRKAVEEAKKIYRLPICSRTFNDNMKQARPCLNAHIGLCRGVCTGKVSHEEYLESVKGAVDFLKKGSADTVKELTIEMEAAAENLEFEKAARLRDTIDAIRRLNEKQKVVMAPVENQDIIAFVEGEKYACFEVFVFRNARLCDREHFFVDAASDDNTLRSEFLMQYYSIRSDIPQKILLDKMPEDNESIERYLSEKVNKKVSLFVPLKGGQKELLNMCRENAAERVAQKEGMKIRQTQVLDELRSLLGLKSIPRRIEAYDISNTAGTHNVAGMVVFCDAKPYKNAYRKFAIKSFSGQDDYGSMREVIERRMQEYEKNKNTDNEFGVLPDLILLDGGAGQLSAVLPVLQKYGMQYNVFGMVKDSHHKTRALVSQYGEIAIKPTRSVFTFISTVQDEVHRFAISYHHSKASKSALSLQLLQIEGIGKTRAENLLKSFGSVDKIASADVESLAAVKGMTVSSAQKIYDYFHGE